MKIELLPDEIDGLLEAVDLALGDQRSYLMIGNPSSDYGDEWPETAQEKARKIRGMSAVMTKMGYSQIAKDCEDLATDMEASAQEYENPAVGN